MSVILAWLGSLPDPIHGFPTKVYERLLLRKPALIMTPAHLFLPIRIHSRSSTVHGSTAVCMCMEAWVRTEMPAPRLAS